MNIDVSHPIENPALKELLMKRRAQPESAQNLEGEIYREVVEHAKLLSVVRVSPAIEKDDKGEVVLQEDTTLSLPTLSLEDGRRFYPAFTDWEEVYRWESALKNNVPLNTLILTFEDYVALVQKNKMSGMVLNPFSDSLIFEYPLMNRLLEQKKQSAMQITSHTVAKGAVKLGEPAVYPEKLMKELCSYAKRQKNIETLWLRLMEQSGELSYLLIAKFSGDQKSVFEGIAAIAQPYLGEMCLDMMPLQNAFTESAVAGVEPFYRKKRGLFGR